MRLHNTVRQTLRHFEIPYNYDIDYCKTLKACGLIDDHIEFIYMAPFHEDYTGVVRHDITGASKFTREQYVMHINEVKKYFSGKMQLLLQNKDYLMPLETLQWYIDLGFTAFCCGNYEQAKMIKLYDSNLTTISSIVLHSDKEKMAALKNEYRFIDKVVLDFRFCKNLQAIKQLPENKEYMLLINAVCNRKCDGDHHWFNHLTKEKMICPGKYINSNDDFSKYCLVRPMDLKYFDPYISTYKLQDRSWPTDDIVRDIILYTTDYSYYPGIEYDEDMYTVSQ